MAYKMKHTDGKKASPAKFFGGLGKLLFGRKKRKQQGVKVGEDYEGGESYSDIVGSDGGGGDQGTSGMDTGSTAGSYMDSLEMRNAFGGERRDDNTVPELDSGTSMFGPSLFSGSQNTIQAPIRSGDDAVKKNVDVEVTVNGNKI